MTGDDKNLDEALEGLDEQKRKTISRLARGAAFTVPLVAGFSMFGLSVRAQGVSNSTLGT